MNPTIRESCVRAGNTGFIFTLTFILFVLCGTVNLLNALDAQPAPCDSVAELVNAVNDLEIRTRTANSDTCLVQYERVESISNLPNLGAYSLEQFSALDSAKENARRACKADGWFESRQPRADSVYLVYLNAVVAFKAFNKPNSSNFHSSPERAKGQVVHTLLCISAI